MNTNVLLSQFVIQYRHEITTFPWSVSTPAIHAVHVGICFFEKYD